VTTWTLTRKGHAPGKNPQVGFANLDGLLTGCFRNLLLGTRPQAPLGKALARHLELTIIGEAKSGYNLLLSKALYQSDQHLMTEAPEYALLLVFLALAAIAVLPTLGKAVNNVFSASASSLATGS
jgi:Flp pilus assembly pilin Flp